MLDDHLKIGHPTFDEHHGRLLDEIRTLRGICRFDSASRACHACAAESRISCRKELHGFGRAFVQLWLREVEEEERLLRTLPRSDTTAEAIEDHVREHADISDLVVAATAAAGDIAHGLHVIFEELPARIGRHIVDYDRWLVAQLPHPA